MPRVERNLQEGYNFDRLEASLNPSVCYVTFLKALIFLDLKGGRYSRWVGLNNYLGEVKRLVNLIDTRLVKGSFKHCIWMMAVLIAVGVHKTDGVVSGGFLLIKLELISRSSRLIRVLS